MGVPLVAPVWFVVDNGDLVFNTRKGTAKDLALERDPRVVICVDDPRPRYEFVQVHGTAAPSDEPGELVVRVTPDKVISAFGMAG